MKTNGQVDRWLSRMVLLVMLMLVGGIFPQFEQTSPGQDAAEPLMSGQFKKLVQIESDNILECSGIAISRSHPDHFWLHNDSGAAATVYLVSPTGKTRAEMVLQGIRNTDFEDIVSFRHESRNFVAVADCGDNLRRRKQLQIHLFEEPASDDLEPRMELEPWSTLNYRYEDGVARDCEALAYWPGTTSFLLVSKPTATDILRGAQAELFAVSFEWKTAAQEVVARKLGQVAGGLITAMDCSTDGRQLVVRNYLYGNLWSLDPSQVPGSLTEATARRIKLPLQRQSEAICFSADGRSLFTTSEGKHQALFEIGNQ